MKTAFDDIPKWVPVLINHYDRPKIKSIRKQKDGIVIADFYLWLLLESAKSEGRLRLSKRYPYNAKNLSEMTEYDEDILVKGLFMLEEMDLIEIDEDKTIIVPEYVRLMQLIAESEKTGGQIGTNSKKGPNPNDGEENEDYKPGYKVKENDD